MSKTIYVKNLPKNVSSGEVQALFVPHGPVQSVKIVKNPQSGRPRVYGVVTMPPVEAQAAVEALNGRVFKGHRLKVNQSGGQQRSRSS